MQTPPKQELCLPQCWLLGKQPTCCFRTWLVIIAKHQGTASLRHLEGKEALKDVHAPFNALEHLIWFAHAMDDPVRDVHDKPRISRAEGSIHHV